MKRIELSFLLIIYTLDVFPQEYIHLWPNGKMINSLGLDLERVEERERETQVAIPGMYAFFISKKENQGSTIIICPSGGYQHHYTYFQKEDMVLLYEIIPVLQMHGQQYVRSG